MSEIGCSCPCDATDYDPPRVFNEKIVRARREYKCYECGDEIKKGQRYCRVSLLTCDEDWETYHICVPCNRIGKDLANGCWLFGGLRETIDECLGFDYLRTGPEDEDEEEE